MTERVVTVKEFGGKVIRSTHVYDVIDHDFLKGLALSKTVLHEGQNTAGHKHADSTLDEVYIFFEGVGHIEVDGTNYHVEPGTIVQINGPEFHKVFNTGKGDLVFVSVFMRYER